MADTLKFGPEWLRALSDGNSVGTPPPSPGFGKYKLAEYRYGREEMLALYNSKAEIPEELLPMTSILVEKVQEPLALVGLSDEEQRIMSQSVNSVAVLRMFGRGGPPGVRGGRGGSTDRGRGRGRGRGDGYIQRGTSYDESGGGFGRPPNTNRADGWEEVGPKRNYQNRFEDSSGVVRPGFQRSLSSDNWREREGGEEDEGDGDWRKAGPKIGNRTNWRDPSVRGGFDPDRNRSNGLQRGGFDRDKGRRSRTSESWDDEDNLPEWSMPDDDNAEEVGTFDSSGAFVSTKTKTDIKEEVLKKEEPSPEPPENKEKTDNEKVSEKVKVENSEKKKDESAKKKTEEKPSGTVEKVLPQREQKTKDKVKQKQQPKENNSSSNSNTGQIKKSASAEKAVTSTTKTNEKVSQSDSKKPNQEKDSAKSVKLKENNSAEKSDSLATAAAKSVSKKVSEQEALDRLKEAAENMVLAAMTAEDEEKEKTDPNNVIYPQDHENALKWFYKDPQGDMQGPFLASEMAEWFSAGYFTMNLLVKRGSDERFSPLGELIKKWGRVPFLPGPSPPPLLNNPGTQSSPDAAQQQQEQLKVLQQQFMIQQQIMQQQLLMRHLHMQQLQQVMQQLQENEQFKSLSPIQQQQIAMQLLIKQSQIPVLPNDPQKLSPRSSAEAIPGSNTPPLPSDHPSFHRSMSQPTNLSHTPPEDASIWGSINPPVGAGAWSQPTSVWDLGRPTGASPDLEKQLVEQEAEKQKLEFEKEETRKQEEIMKKEEALRKQQEEIMRQKEEMERQRQELERQRLLELQKIEEARKLQEEEIRKRQEQEERLRQIEEENRRKQEEEILRKKQEEEMRRKQEEEVRRRQEEERIRQEEEMRRKLEEEIRLQELRKQEEMRLQELQKQKELEEAEKQKQIEIQKRQEIQRQQELQKQQQEALRKLQQEQLANIQLPSHAQWAKQQTKASSNGQKTKSIVEIQEQEEKEHRIKQEIQRQELQRQQMLALQQQQQLQQKSWSSQIAASTAGSNAKSLLEIQEEQARQIKNEMKNKQQQQPQVKNMTLGTASAWGGGVTSSSHWASEGAWGNVLKAQNTNTSSNGAGGLPGFYDEAIISSKRADPPPSKSRQGNPSEFPALKMNQNKPVSTSSTNKSVKPGKSKKEEEAVQRLFQSNRTDDDFTLWCEKVLKNMATSVDIPTFVAFLKEVESPYEVHDYVRSYLGETKSAIDFAKQFLEKRSQSKQKAKQELYQEDSIWGPAPARDFRQANNQTSESEAQKKTSGKKKKKMMKVDSSILGFTVHAAPDRVNVGEIDVHPIEGPK